MAMIKEYGRIAFLSTYPPQECGLATFTRDLVSAMGGIGVNETEVIAVSDTNGTSYDIKVTAGLEKTTVKYIWCSRP